MQESDLQQRIATAAASAQLRRAEAWVAVRNTVLGLPLRPITLATFDLLVATGNAFVSGKAPVAADVRNFILFHSPGFDPDAPEPSLARWPRRFVIAWRTTRALCPAFTPRRRRDAVTATRFFEAVTEIRAIIDATWADALPPSDPTDAEGALPCRVAAGLHAQFADIVARDYRQWPLPQPLRHTPLAQLHQLARCRDRATLGAGATYYDRAEYAALRDYLRAANAAPTPSA